MTRTETIQLFAASLLATPICATIAFVSYIHLTTPIMLDQQRHAAAQIDIQFQQLVIKEKELEIEYLQERIKELQMVAQLSR